MKKYQYYAVLGILVLGGLAGLTGCEKKETDGYNSFFRQEQEAQQEEIEQPKPPSKEDSVRYSTFGYNQLSGVEQIWYRDIEQILLQMEEKGNLSEAGLKAGLDESCIDRIFQRVMDDHPELFYVDGYSYTNYTRDIRTVAIEFSGTYNLSPEEAMAYREQIDTEVEKLLNGLCETKDDYEKVKFTYETLILNTEYDLNAPRNQDIYSVFVEHASVCQGYAKAFQYLCNRLGVECALIQGRVKSTGELHTWNLVRADGDYYYVDTTWGDVTFDKETDERKEIPKISYDYLCVTDQVLGETHEPEEGLILPECYAVADNYYVREGARFDTYDTEKLKMLISRAIQDGSNLVTLQCTGQECYEQMHRSLIEEKEFFTFLEETQDQEYESFVYMDNDSQFTLTFFMMTSN